MIKYFTTQASSPETKEMLDCETFVTSGCTTARGSRGGFTFTADIIQVMVTAVSVKINGAEFNYRELLRVKDTC